MKQEGNDFPARTPQSPKGEDQRSTFVFGMNYGANPELFEFAKELRKKQTPSEKILWNRLKNKQILGFKFRRQHPIENYIADFYCHKLKFVIELDGGYHLSSDQTKHDINRDGVMKEFGIFVRRIKNDAVLNHLERTIEEIIEDIEMLSN